MSATPVNIHLNTCEIKNEIDLVERIISIYSIIKFTGSDRLREFEKNILVYYVRKGISDDTLDMVCADLNKKKNHLHGINKQLRDKGYLITCRNNMRKFELNEDLKSIRQTFIEKKYRLYTIGFRNV